jgi:hypothetical protein
MRMLNWLLVSSFLYLLVLGFLLEKANIHIFIIIASNTLLELQALTAPHFNVKYVVIDAQRPETYMALIRDADVVIRSVFSPLFSIFHIGGLIKSIQSIASCQHPCTPPSQSNASKTAPTWSQRRIPRQRCTSCIICQYFPAPFFFLSRRNESLLQHHLSFFRLFTTAPNLAMYSSSMKSDSTQASTIARRCSSSRGLVRGTAVMQRREIVRRKLCRLRRSAAACPRPRTRESR